MGVRLSECTSCRAYAGAEHADGIAGETLSPGARAILRTLVWDGDCGSCPSCGTWYRYRAEQHAFEDDTYFERVTAWEAGHDPDVSLLLPELALEATELRVHAARSLAQHLAKTRDLGGLGSLLCRGEPGLALQAIAALGGVKRLQGREALAAVAAVAANLEHPDEPTRRAAAYFLAGRQLRRRRREQVAALLAHPDRAVRRGALACLRERDVPALARALRALLDDADAETRAGAARLLAARAGVEERLALLVHAAPEVRHAAVLSLNDVEDLDVGPYVAVLGPLLADGDYFTRGFAAIHLTNHFVAERSVAEVAALLAQPIADVRRWVVTRLFAASDRSPYLPLVARLVLDPDAEVAVEAALFLGDRPEVRVGDAKEVIAHFERLGIAGDYRARSFLARLRR